MRRRWPSHGGLCPLALQVHAYHAPADLTAFILLKHCEYTQPGQCAQLDSLRTAVDNCEDRAVMGRLGAVADIYMRGFAFLSLVIATSLPAVANIQEDIHQKCVTAADYEGCVNVNSKISKINGNACEPGFAFQGQDTCVEVLCMQGRSQHAAIIAGKMWTCTKQPGDVFIHILDTGKSSDMIYNFSCPGGKPEVGWNSTCNSPYKEPAKKDRIEGRRT